MGVKLQEQKVQQYHTDCSAWELYFRPHSRSWIFLLFNPFLYWVLDGENSFLFLVSCKVSGREHSTLSTCPLRLCTSLKSPSLPPLGVLLVVPESFRFHRPLVFVCVNTTPLKDAAGFDIDIEHSVKIVLPNVNCLAGRMYWLKSLLSL